MGQGSRMKGKRCRSECQEWPIDAIRAMETHLKLLRKAGNDYEEEEECTSDCSDIVVEKAAIAGNKVEEVRVVELNTHQSPLPKGWEQFLDLQTGRMYFVDWSICKKSRFDPRKLVQLANHKVSSLLQQPRTQWEPQPQILVDNSLCVSELVSEMQTIEEMEVQSRYTGTLHDEVVNGDFPRESRTPTGNNDHLRELTSESPLHSLPI